MPTDRDLVALGLLWTIKLPSPDAEKRESAHPIRPPASLVVHSVACSRLIGPGANTKLINRLCTAGVDCAGKFCRYGGWHVRMKPRAFLRATNENGKAHSDWKWRRRWSA